MADVRALHKFLRDEFDSEARGGFARLGRVPDTYVRRFLDYYVSLNPSEQDALADASALRGALKLAGGRAHGCGGKPETYPAWERWRREMGTDRWNAPRYYPAPLLRGFVALAKSDRAKGVSSFVSKELEEYAASVRGVKAPELRKHVRASLKQLLGARPFNLGGGGWDYEGTLGGSRVRVNIDYGGRAAQLRYGVDVETAEPPASLRRVGLEVLLGVGVGDWDFITEENLGDAIALLSECVAYVAELPRRLPERCLGWPDG